MADYIRDLRPAKWGTGNSSRGTNSEPPMSALGQNQTSAYVQSMSALPPKADIDGQQQEVCATLIQPHNVLGLVGIAR